MDPGVGQDRRLRVVVVSHSYNEPGRLPTLGALAKHADLTLIGPQKYQHTSLSPADYHANGRAPVIIALPAKLLGGTQFLLRGLTKAIRSSRPDVVCVEYDLWNPMFLQVVMSLAVARSHARIVAVVKKNTYRSPNSILGRSKRLLSQWGARRASAIIAASEMAREVYVDDLGIPESKVVVQPHLSVDVDRFRPRERDDGQRPVRIGFIGKIGALKGLPELLSAFGQVAQRTGANPELWLAGKITDPEIATEISATAQVHHVGMIHNDELHVFMNDIDIFVMPARILPDHQEHDGRAVLEAMASGLPCVVSNSGILPEIVSSQEGRVFPAGDAASLTEALEELVKSPELRMTLGNRARQRAVETVSPEVHSARRLSVFADKVEEPHDR